MSAPVMSMFANELYCLRARDKYHTDRIAELEEELDEWRHGERTYPNYNEDYKDMCRKAVAAEQEVARLAQDNTRLESHIRAIAEHHQERSTHYMTGSNARYQRERRDVALSGLKGK